MKAVEGRKTTAGASVPVAVGIVALHDKRGWKNTACLTRSGWDGEGR